MLLLLLAGALPWGGWLLVAGAPSTRAAAPPQPLTAGDAPDPRAARRVAAATQAPDRPGPPSSAPTRPAPATEDAASAPARCGEDQLPVYKTPEPEADGMIKPEEPVPDADGVVRHRPGEIKPAGVGFTGAQRRIDAALRATGDPFDRSVADWLNVDGLRTPVLQLDALVQDALVGNDAPSYALAVEACSDPFVGFTSGQPRPTSPACSRVSIDEWVRRDPGNGLPWLYALQAADAAGDRAAQDEAMRRMASAARFDLHWGAGPAAVARLRMASDADLAAQVDLAMRAMSMSPMPSWGAVVQRCRDGAGGDHELAQRCDAIGAAMFDHSDTLIARALGARIHQHATGDPSRVEQARRERAALGASPHDAPEPAPCASARALLQHLVRIATVGELAAARERSTASAPR